jgi:ABC-type branched-subunit amino acid transport system substrate-binding protein
MRSRSRRRQLTTLVAFVLVSSACSGGGFPKPQTVALSPAGNDGATPTPGGSAGPGQSPGPDGTPTATGGPGPSPTSGGPGDPTQSPPPEAALFTASEDRIGISDTTITMCGHAALTYAAAFNTQPEDLNVYWDMVRDNGGIYDRNVDMTFEDDKYTPTDALVAAEACYQKNPFILVGGIGFDQIPAVRTFAESHHMLYIHHVARQDYTKRYSFSALPTVEQMGKLAAQWIATQHPGKKIGALYRDSENWDPGYKAFVSELKRLHQNFYGGSPVASDQRQYNTILGDFQDNGVEVVFGWENALNGTNMVLQAKGQDYNPQWVLFPFNLETDTLKAQALDPPLEGIAAWSAYTPGDYSGPFAQYANEIHLFEAAYAKYRPTVKNLTDLHWQVWLAWKTVHNLLLACGPDCTRNKMVGVLLDKPYGYDFTQPDCPVDFTRNGHVGGFAVSFFRAYARPAGQAGWRPIPGFTCRESLV